MKVGPTATYYDWAVERVKEGLSVAQVAHAKEWAKPYPAHPKEIRVVLPGVPKNTLPIVIRPCSELSPVFGQLFEVGQDFNAVPRLLTKYLGWEEPNPLWEDVETKGLPHFMPSLQTAGFDVLGTGKAMAYHLDTKRCMFADDVSLKYLKSAVYGVVRSYQWLAELADFVKYVNSNNLP
jgi:hypothetical protein